MAARSLRWNKFARWTIPRLGFATNERMDLLLSKLLHCRTFEQLKLPLAVVAGDIRIGEAVTFREGDLIMPVRASCSFPGLFVPIEYKGRLLVDGVVVESVPVAALRGMDVVVAVNVQNKGFIERPSSLFEVVGESFRIAQNLNQSNWRDHCDLVIEPMIEDFHWDEFGRADELIAAGEMAAWKALPALRNLLRERATQVATQGERHRNQPGFSLSRDFSYSHFVFSVMSGGRSSPAGSPRGTLLFRAMKKMSGLWILRTFHDGITLVQSAILPSTASPVTPRTTPEPSRWRAARVM